MRTRWLSHGLGLLIFLAICQAVIAQQPMRRSVTPTPPARSAGASAEALSKQAFQLAQSAKTLEQLTEALRVCSQAAKASPTSEQKDYIYQLAGWVYNKRGEALTKLADQTRATDESRSADYEAAALRDFDLSVRFDDQRWKPRFNRAVSKAMTGEYQIALQDLDFVLTKQPSHKNARFNRAEILLQLGEYQRAIDDYSEVIQVDPNDGAAFAGRGIALAAIGQSDDAMADLNAVVRLQPEHAAAYVDRADLYAALGDWKRAAGDYRVAISLDEKSARAYQNVAWLMATCPEKKYRNPTLAVKAAKRAIELQGTTYLGLDTYAAALASVGQYTKAASAQQQAIASAPQGEVAALESRLALYQQQRPYFEQLQSNVRLASAQVQREDENSWENDDCCILCLSTFDGQPRLTLLREKRGTGTVRRVS